MEIFLKIKGIENFSTEQLNDELQRGGRFVIYQYCISILIMSFKRNSTIYFIPAEDASRSKAFGFILISLLAGWWGVPWGPIWTVGTVVKNFRGGIDVTANVMVSLKRMQLHAAA